MSALRKSSTVVTPVARATRDASPICRVVCSAGRCATVWPWRAMTSGRAGRPAMNSEAAAAYASPRDACSRAISDSLKGTSAPARSTASRMADGYGCSAVAMTRTFGRGPGSTSIAARFIPSPDVPDIMPTAIIRRFSRERRRHGFVHRDAEAVHLVVVATTEVHAVREEDHREIEPRVDPDRRAREAGVPVGVDAEVAPDHRTVRRAQRETDPAPNVALLHVLRPRECGEVVPDDGAVAEDPRDRRHIGGRPEEARVPRRPRE